MAIKAIELSESIASAVELAGKSVVRVEGRRGRSSSGVVWAAGQVVAASHAVESDEGVTIAFAEGKEARAKVLGRDPSTDLILLQAEGGAPATFDDGAALKVGHLVLALGRPGKTVRATSGIVSALGTGPFRTRLGGELDRYFESDAPHIPGFSGGPLIDVEGRVLGLNTTGLMRGSSLVIPTPTVRRVVAQLQQHGRVRRGYLGVSSQPVRLPDAVRAATGEALGLLVLAVEPGGPADKAGIAFGDTVLKLGGDDIQDLADLQAFLRADNVGKSVPVKLWRAGQVLDTQLTVGQRP